MELINIWLFHLFIFFTGLCIGSFANVLIYRIPLNLTIHIPGSFCPNCNKKIEWHDNIPVLSYILLKGRCRNCKVKISLIYPFIEILTAIIIFFIWIKYKNIMFLGYSLLFFSLIVISIIDIRHRIIPDVLSIPLAVSGILFSVININLGEVIYLRVINSLVGGISGSLIFYIVSYAGMKIYRKEVLGMGDVKLVGAIGTYFGFHNLIISIFIGSLLGTLISLYMILILKKKKWSDYIPYGPFLSSGAVIYFFLFL